MRLTTSILISRSTISAAIALALPCSALAQESATLTEITVTAQKRSERLSEVPVTVNALSGELVERLKITDARSALAQIPNAMSSSVFGVTQQPSLSLRGVSLNNFNDSFESPVAFYIDDVYQGSLIGQSAGLFDVERIEVLKGPQGTLYGRNATGGLMHVITRGPTREFEARAAVEFGENDLRVFSAAIGGPMGERVRGRLAAESRQADGWNRGFVDGVRYSDEDSIAVRGRLDVDVTADAQLSLGATYSKADVLSVGFGLRGYLDPASGDRCSLPRIESGACVSPALGGLSANDFGGLRPGASFGSDLTADRGEPPRQSVELRGASAKLDWDLGSWTLTSILAYDRVEKLYEEDLDGPGFNFNDGLSLDGREFKAELRAAGTAGAHRWLVGAFWFDDRKDTGSFLIPAEIFRTRGVVDSESWALFAQDDFALDDRWTLTVGGRYTQEDKELRFSRTGFIEDAAERSLSADNFSGKVALSFKPVDGVLVYGSVSTGFKTGGFNTQFVFGALDEIDPVDNEKLTAYEIGSKFQLWSGRAQLNLAAFHYDYRDVQLVVLTTVPGAPFPSNFLRNAGDATLQGLDIDLTVQPLDTTTLMLGLGVLDSKLKSSEVVVSGGETIAVDGNQLPKAPKLTVNVAANQDIPLGDRGTMYLQADYSWRDAHFFTFANAPTERQASYGILNAAVGWRSPDERWDVHAYLQNAADEEYSVFSINLSPTFGTVTWGRPQWWGARASYRF